MIKEAFFEKLKDIPLKVRLLVDIQIVLLSLPSEMGYRSKVMWTDEEQNVLDAIDKASKKLTDSILETIKEWEEDGRPV